MRREKLGSVLSPNFIGCWTLENEDVCDGLIDYFERNADCQKPGFVGSGFIDTSIKKSLDITILPKHIRKPGNEVFAAYFEQLNECFWDYLDDWDILKNFLKDAHIGSFNIQRYDDRGHFGGLHSERTALGSAHRVLVWMTYLNDVPAGGETEFPYFGVKVIPVRGRTLIWPAEWTHAHRGCVVEKGPKYIITGWMHFAT